MDLVTDTLQKIFVWVTLCSDKTLILPQQFITMPLASIDVKTEAISALKFIPSKEVDTLLSVLLLIKNKKNQLASRKVIEFRKEKFIALIQKLNYEKINPNNSNFFDCTVAVYYLSSGTKKDLLYMGKQSLGKTQG